MEEADEKKQLRVEALAARDSLPENVRQAYSGAVVRNLTALSCYRRAQAVLVYISFRSEVSTASLVKRAYADGKAVFAPKVSGREMEFFLISGQEDLAEGYHGIREPKGGMPYTDWIGHCQRSGRSHNTLICLPGAAFDKKCHRIGYGGGFYDRYLGGLAKNSKDTSYCTAALAFGCQIFEEIPWEAHDICPKMIVTENEVIVSGEDFGGGFVETEFCRMETGRV